MGSRARLSEQIVLRLSTEDLKRLDSLTTQIPIANRNAIAREALRIGLSALETDPAKLLKNPVPGASSRRVLTGDAKAARRVDKARR